MSQGAQEAGDGAAATGDGLAPGSVVADRYRIQHLLGEGGMGAVYRAEHVHMRKAFALKVLHPDAGEFPEVVARFEREAIAAANIDHPNVVSATDFGKLPDGSFFLVLEFVDGESLRDAIAKGPMGEELALHIVREIASALVVAHRSGVVHRDLKPENVMLVARPNALDAIKIFDFGIAKIDVGSVTGKDGSTLQPITRVGTVFGTPDYMAPEQAMGQPVDGRADLYALGVMLFEMLTGSRPYKGGAVTLMRQHILQDVPELPQEVSAKLDPRVGEILKRLLAKDVDGRYATAAELVEAIDDVLGRQQSGPPASPSTKPVAKSAPPSRTSTPRLEGGEDASRAPMAGLIMTPPGEKGSWRPVARAAYSAEQSTRRKRRVVAIGSGLALVVLAAAGAFFWSSQSHKPSRPAHASPNATATATTSALSSATSTASAAPIEPTTAEAPKPADSVSPAPTVAATDPPATFDGVETAPATSVSASSAPPPASVAPHAPTKAAPRNPPQKGGGGGSVKGKPQRKTGPGGIYIPPPKDWLK